MEYKKVKLGDYFDIKKGKKVEPIDSEDVNSYIRYLQIDDLRNNNNLKYCENKKEYVISNKEDIIIAWDGANAGTVNYGLNGAIGSTLAIMSPKKECYIPFVGKFLQSKFNYLRGTCTGATIPHIQRNVLDNIQIPLPPLENQKKIADALDKAQELIDKRKEQIRLMDEFIKSVFVDMFGDPVSNPMGWNIKKLGEIIKVETGSTPSRDNEEYYKNGNISWIKTTEVKGESILESEEHITEIAIKETNCKIYPINTILIAMYGQGKTRGRVGLMQICGATNQACAALLPHNNYNTIFLFNQLKILYSKIRSLGRGGNQPNLNLSLVKGIEVYVPPIDLQNKFAQIVADTEKQKQLMEQGLKEMENNFNSIMQQAFRGELFV